MQEIILDEEFQRILPKLSEQTLIGLEANLLEFGCLMPLVLWNDILIDGYNRYEILRKHDLPFNTINMEFPTREDVKIWIIQHQIERRNLNPIQLSYYRGLHYNLDKLTAGNPTGKNQFTEEHGQIDHVPLSRSTALRLSDEYNVSPRTIRRDSQIAAAINKIGEVSPEIKMDILSGEINITKRQLKEIESGTVKDLDIIVEQMLDGTFEKSKGETSKAVKKHISSVSFPVSLQSFNAINDITNTFYTKLQKLSSNEDAKGSKSALRLYIDTLEKLYEQI
ncbi:MAG: hypothetical protein LBC73_07260 [Oscillospiraceae bacterium]|jgi:hypothetical protein|nr:hypothetical protein [Oscillospiraceae bacterium]